jgi:hypothetical protein
MSLEYEERRYITDLEFYSLGWAGRKEHRAGIFLCEVDRYPI